MAVVTGTWAAVVVRMSSAATAAAVVVTGISSAVVGAISGGTGNTLWPAR